METPAQFIIQWELDMNMWQRHRFWPFSESQISLADCDWQMIFWDKTAGFSHSKSRLIISANQCFPSPKEIRGGVCFRIVKLNTWQPGFRLSVEKTSCVFVRYEVHTFWSWFLVKTAVQRFLLRCSAQTNCLQNFSHVRLIFWDVVVGFHLR